MLPQSLHRFIGFFIKRQWIGFTALMILHLAWVIDMVIMPYVFKIFTDIIINYEGDRADIWEVIFFPVALGAGLWILTDAMFRIYDAVSARTFPAFEAAIRTAMFRYVQNHSHQFFADHFAGSVANKINDMPDGATRIMQLILTLFIPSFLAFVVGMLIFASMHPMFAVIMVVWVCLHIGVCLLLAKRCNELSYIHSENKSTLSGIIVDCFTNVLTMKLFAKRRFEYDTMQHYQAIEQESHKDALKFIAKIRLIQGVLCFLICGIILFGFEIYSWIHGHITASEFVYIFYTSWNITIMAWICGIELPNFFKEVGICRQAMTIVNVPHTIIDADGAGELRITKGEVVFEEVTFHYNRNQNVFENKSVTIHSGQKVGLVGFSGSGKTTFVNLILRFFDVESGVIRIDGQDISQVTQESLRSRISMIPQDPSLFHRSLQDNIRYGKQDATDEEVLEAARKAHCHEFIKDLPQGYGTMVGERGIKLSGGQRQRIAIARAMLKNAPILILDEATSALDSITEKKIQDGLNHLMQGKTTIVIAHRLSTLSYMDRILVFKEGHIIEDGSHSELIAAKEGHYAKLWEMQAEGFLPG